ncbi:hypothetical protein NE237_004538 [Protea cynaroides]|uniref:Uncharacterized protein n=1 Tax=Protea cynaroides TaxID=273540 RepID=A0A9Q0KJL8_9MAGN|nr:hypothetical protein NE237_004538 [Protea cynaroides]
MGSPLGISRIEVEAESETMELDFNTLMLSNLKLLGDAHLNNGGVHLSCDLAIPYSGVDRVLYSKSVRFRQPDTSYPPFSTFFCISVINLNPSSIGGGLVLT